MTLPKLLFFAALMLFATIGVIALFKGGKDEALPQSLSSPTTARMEVFINSTPVPVKVEPKPPVVVVEAPVKKIEPIAVKVPEVVAVVETATDDSDMPREIDRTQELFSLHGPKFPFVETITYRSRVQWQKGRPAWLSDYANHYTTSRHFIARSLNRSADYLKQDVLEGDKFNVYRKDKSIEFYLLLDTSRCKMWLYAIDTDQNERYLIKSYKVGVGRADAEKVSGLLTPLGKYSLGNKIAIYKPKAMGHHNGQKVEMIRIFGTRWVPFEKELSDKCTSQAKGFGLHGAPWIANSKGELTEDLSSIGKYESDGCIRLSSKDIEEIFAIIITKPTTIELVRNYKDAVIPGVEKP